MNQKVSRYHSDFAYNVYCVYVLHWAFWKMGVLYCKENMVDYGDTRVVSEQIGCAETIETGFKFVRFTVMVIRPPYLIMAAI